MCRVVFYLSLDFVYFIWMERNDQRHNGTSLSAEHLVSEIKLLVRDRVHSSKLFKIYATKDPSIVQLFIDVFFLCSDLVARVWYCSPVLFRGMPKVLVLIFFFLIFLVSNQIKIPKILLHSGDFHLLCQKPLLIFQASVRPRIILSKPSSSRQVCVLSICFRREV